MQLLDSLDILTGGEHRTIELWQGDLTNMPPKEAVDILVVSAFPNSYYPTHGTLIGALAQKNVSATTLAQNKEKDLRDSCYCWLSKEVKAADIGIQFKHILCFEPATFGNPTDVVSEIFRSMVPFIIGDLSVTQVAMPLVSTGRVGAPLVEMVEALFSAAIHWMESGLPLKRLKIVELSPLKAAEIKGAFGILKRRHQQLSTQKRNLKKYDVFISYCHANSASANFFLRQLKEINPNLHIFIDHDELVPGIAWQEKLYRSLDESKKVLALYSPEYVKSANCQEEFNFSALLHTRSGGKTLFPVLLHETILLPQMGKWQYTDCKEADPVKMSAACSKLIDELATDTPATLL